MKCISTNEAAIGKIRQRACNADICMIITIDTDGKTSNRPIGAVKVDDEGNCWFFASRSSGKVKDISVNNKVQVVMANPATEDYMEIHGEGTVVCDGNEIADKWSPLVNSWFPNGINDPQVCLVRIEMTSVFYCDAATQGIKRLSIHNAPAVEHQRLAA